MDNPVKAVVIRKAPDLRIEERDAETAGPGQVSVAIRRGGICGKPLLTNVLPIEDATKAFELALDRSRAMKVQIAF